MIRILLVDDEKNNVDSIVSYLKVSEEAENWEIHTANSAETAIASFDELVSQGKTIDILLTDMVMESIDSGIGLIKHINQKDPSIISILFTANEMNVSRFNILETGVFEVIEKNLVGTEAVREIVLKTKKAIELKERIKKSVLFGTYIDGRLSERLNANGEIPLKNQILTVVFWDIRGFSRACEILKHHPDLISEFISEYNSHAVEIIGSNGGIIDKFIGDGIMALFGYDAQNDSDHESSAMSAVRSALQLKRVFSQITQQHKKIWDRRVAEEVQIEIGAGIHTGDVLFGELGNLRRRNVTAIGANVNLTARIEGLAKSGEVLISNSTRAYLGDKIAASEFTLADNIKNISGTFRIFSVAGIRD